jgi:hypothetical protein
VPTCVARLHRNLVPAAAFRLRTNPADAVEFYNAHIAGVELAYMCERHVARLTAERVVQLVAAQ